MERDCKDVKGEICEVEECCNCERRDVGGEVGWGVISKYSAGMLRRNNNIQLK